MHYNAHAEYAFASVQHIVRDVNYGWLIRNIHANGASLFFIAIYLHTFRGLYYGSFLYPREGLWIVGATSLILMIATAFLGYVLPWGQMSFWGATVITNLFSAIPVIGESVVSRSWGGSAVGSPTLQRFYVLHFLLPFIISALVGLHLLILHETGSNNPLGIAFASESGITFDPYYTTKDTFGTLVAVFLAVPFIYFVPNLLGHPDNFIQANPLYTPKHIVPEWYFLPFYAILRSVPDKLAGVLALVLALGFIFSIPFVYNPPYRSMAFADDQQIIFFVFVTDCILLGWVGGRPVSAPYLLMGQAATLFYFLYFIWLYTSTQDTLASRTYFGAKDFFTRIGRLSATNR
jgi:ubiquinol-cytochrome c reductase cytochrome b subunit